MKNEMLRPLNICLVAGGSGGHVMPAVALSQEILKTNAKLLLLTDPRGQKFWPQALNDFLHVLPCSNMRKSGFIPKIYAFWQFLHSLILSLVVLRRAKPDIVIGFGGYPTAMPLLAAWLMNIDFALFELDRRIGFVNRFFRNRAKLKLSASKLTDSTFSHIGLPVREDIDGLFTKAYVSPQTSQTIQLLIVGGSQGARIFDEMIPAAIKQLDHHLQKHIHIVQQTSLTHMDTLKRIYHQLGVQASLRNFFPDMSHQLSEAHLVISRSGASTLAELALAKKPAIFIPYPHAAENHQHTNAIPYVESGAAWLLDEKDMSAEKLAYLLKTLLNDDRALIQASEAMAKLAKPRAANQALKIILATIRKNECTHLHKK